LFKRNFVCLIIIAILSACMIADDAGAAILHNNGGVLLNGSTAPETATIFPGDTIQIQNKSAARIEVTGSTIDLNSETVVQFESDEIHLDHGSVSVNTSRAFKVRVGCVTVTPVNMDWTRYVVTDTDSKVKVDALKNDVYIDAHSANPQQVKKSALSRRVIVREGEQKSREEKCGSAADFKDEIAARGAILNSPYVQWPAIGVIGGITCWALCRSDDPISPSGP
jgi:hypothetical protein